MSMLMIKLSDGRSFKQKLTQEDQVLGRDPGCGIVLDDPSASRRHAVMRYRDNRYFVEDLGSKNGTLVNDARVQSAALSHHDEILIGSVELKFVEGDDDSTHSPSSVVVADTETKLATASYTSQSATLQLTALRLQMLYDLSERLTTLRDRDALLEDAMSICFETLRFERGAIAVRKPDKRGVDWPIVRNLRGAGGELTISRSLLSRALEHGERAILTDGTQGRIDPTVSMVQHGIQSAMCVPLMTQNDVIGVIYGDRTSTSTVYTSEDIDFLAGIARQVTIGLVNSQLMEQEKRRLEMEAELGVARDIQQNLFPREMPEQEWITVAALNEPGRTVSGDYYDVIDMGNGRIGFLIADVTGKGVAASLLMSNLQAAVRLTLAETHDVGVAMTRWNSLLFANTDASKFVTCLTGIIDPRERSLTFSLAGHPPPYLVDGSADSPRLLIARPELPLGVVDQVDYGSTTVDLGPNGCTIFCYTDGIAEAMSVDHAFFGEERMEAVLKECPDLAPNVLIRRMRKAISQFAKDAVQSDDITMVAAHLIGTAPSQIHTG